MQKYFNCILCLTPSLLYHKTSKNIFIKYPYLQRAINVTDKTRTQINTLNSLAFKSKFNFGVLYLLARFSSKCSNGLCCVNKY